MKWLSILLSLALLAAIGFSQNRSRGFPTGPIVDLSYAFDSETVYWPTAQPFVWKRFGRCTEQGFTPRLSYSGAAHVAPLARRSIRHRLTALIRSTRKLLAPQSVASRSLRNQSDTGTTDDS